MDITNPKDNKKNQNQNKSNEWQIVNPPPTELKPYSPEWFLFNYLENWTDDDLRIAVENDVRPDLSTYADLILEQTTDFFQQAFKIHRPDMKVAQTPDGKEWIRRIVKSATGFR